MQTREEGFYWIKVRANWHLPERWIVAEWTNDFFYSCGSEMELEFCNKLHNQILEINETRLMPPTQ